MTTSILVNGQNLTSVYGLSVDGLPQWRSGPSSRRNRIVVNQRSGVLFTSPVLTNVRELQITGTMQQATAALAVTNEDSVKSILTSGLIRVNINDGGGFDRIVDGYAEQIDVQPFGASMTPLATRWNVTVACTSPYWRVAQPSYRALVSAGVRYTLPLGTAPSTPIIRLIGAGAPVVTYSDASGTTIKTLDPGLTLGANDWLDIDMRTVVMTLYTAGVASNVTAFTGNFPWAFDPQDGDWATSQWPGISISAGTGMVYWWNNYL